MTNTQSFENRQLDQVTLGDLRSAVIWCAWQQEYPWSPLLGALDFNGKPRKIAYRQGQRRARSNDPDGWLTWHSAMGMAKVLPVDRRYPDGKSGVGVLLGGLGLCGLDLDACIGPGGLAAWAADIIEALGSGYVEVSPSGQGLKAFLLIDPAELEAVRTVWQIDPYGHGRSIGLKSAGERAGARLERARGERGEHAPGVEFYHGARWFAVTGDCMGAMEPLGRMTPAVAEAVVQVMRGHGMDVARRSGGGGVRGTENEYLTDEELAAIDDALGLGVLEAWERLAGVPGSVIARKLEELEGTDDRSAIAMAIMGELRAAGMVRGEVFKIIRMNGMAGWFEEKARMDGGRQLMRIWNAVAGREPRRLGAVELEAEDRGREWKAVGADAAVGADEPPIADKPVINVRAGIDEIVDEAELALEKCGTEVFQRGGTLVRPYALEMDTWGGRKTLVPAFDQLTTHSAIDVLAKTVDWEIWSAKAKANVRTDPTDKIANIWLSRRGQWRARRIKGIITSPTIRPDGSLLTKAGYDSATRLFMMVDPGLVMPSDGQWRGEKLVKADAETALKSLEGLLADFPFTGKADYSVALSGLLTPVVRGALDKRPLHVFDAPNPGTGKTYLVEICTALALGQSAPVSSWSLEDSENEKRLSSLLLSGAPVGILDNINGVLNSDLLCQALDQSTLRVRVFGKLENRDVENTICLYATGNNIAVFGDLVRRALVSKLDAQMERPEIRKFSGDPLLCVQQDRGHYLAAALTVVRAHMQAGYPGCEGMQPMASFNEWGRLVRGALRWLGRADPVDTAERTFREDPKRSDLLDFVEAWVRRYGYEPISVRDAVARLPSVSGDNKPLPESMFTREAKMDPADVVSAFRDAALRIAGRNDIIDVKLLGNWLKRNKGAVIKRHRFVTDNNAGNHDGKKWRVELVQAPLTVVNNPL